MKRLVFVIGLYVALAAAVWASTAAAPAAEARTLGNSVVAATSEGETCPQCGYENEAGLKFCIQCGTPLSDAPRAEEVMCPKCQARMPYGVAFCRECGYRFMKETGPPRMFFGMPSFDGGTEVEFNAEDNATIGYVVNPAKLAYYERSAFLFDVGGDWSIGSLKYDENGGTVEPGTPPDPGESAAELKVNLAMGGTGFAVFKTGSMLVGVGGGLDWNKLSVGFSGVSFPEIGYYYEGEVISLTVPTLHAKGVVAFDMKPWALGFSGNYVSAKHKGESEGHNVSSAELGLSNIELLGGVLRRSNGNRFHAAGGAQILKNRLELVEPWDPVESGEAAAKRFLIRAGYRTMLWAKVAFGADLDAKVTPGVVITEDDLSYDIAEGSELDVKIKPGFALYPDEQTTFAFDYNVNFVRVNLDTLASDGGVTGEYALSETWTNTQVGLERWFTDEISIKAGWRQNIFAFPRNTMFAGACYRPNDRWMFNYDFHEGVIAVDKVSFFMTLADLVDPGGHRITLAYYF